MSDYDRLVAACRESAPVAFVVLGSGLGDVVAGLPRVAACRFGDVPGLPPATVGGHRGELVLARWGGKAALVSLGRLHYYEGHPWDAVVLPVRLAAKLGAKVAVLTNAAGGIRDDLDPGALMPLRDHLEWNRPNPWREPARESPYSPRLLALLRRLGGTSEPGVYACVRGPSYETPAEVRALRAAGADAVGMSTTREALAAREAGMEVAAVSLVTNRGAGLSAGPIDHCEVMEAGREAAGRLAGIVERFLEGVEASPAGRGRQ